MTINLIETPGSIHHSQVEWDTLCGSISQFAYFERNKRKLVERIFKDRGELVDELNLISRYQRGITDDQKLIVEQLLGKLPPDDSLSRHLTHLGKSGSLQFSELNKVALLAETGSFLRNDFSRLSLPEFESLVELDLQGFHRKVLREFRHLVDVDGELHLDRHPELAELSRRLRELEDRIRKTIQEWLNDPAHQKLLQFNSYDIHFDRYVVPVRSDSYRSELGLIVSRSETGSTLFIEPYLVREACNRRLEIVAKIDEIINQLALRFSAGFSEYVPMLRSIFEAVLGIDHYLAKAGFAHRYALTQPRILERPGFSFRSLAHPLLQRPIRNDVTCLSSHHGIVISGPNTGGKTVFLKSIALAYLLMYHGHFVPAIDAEMYPYHGLFYFGDDLQDLKTGLSSFSGEVKNYIELLENVTPSNLILIDEIFNSTSSDEASALSLAYFDELHRKGKCHIVVSTHHQMFKTLVHQDQSYVSCHVGFDTDAMKPTYKIIWGTPGSSMAIDIFRILSQGHPEVSRVPDEALGQLSQKNISYETLLQKVTQKQIELDKLLSSNRQLEVELKNQKGAMEGILGLRLQDEVQKAKREIDRIIQEARQIVEDARRNDITKVRRVEEKGHGLRSELGRLLPEEEGPSGPAEAGELRAEDFKPGEFVQSLVLKKEFTVQTVDLRKQEVQISKGPIKITVPARTLVHARGQHPSQQVSVSFQKSRHAQVDLDVRGMRLTECQTVVERALGDLLSGDVPFINIIHGHGDGILKRWIRDLIKNSRDFRCDDSESNNDGKTTVTLR